MSSQNDLTLECHDPAWLAKLRPKAASSQQPALCALCANLMTQNFNQKNWVDIYSIVLMYSLKEPLRFHKDKQTAQIVNGLKYKPSCDCSYFILLKLIFKWNSTEKKLNVTLTF